MSTHDEGYFGFILLIFNVAVLIMDDFYLKTVMQYQNEPVYAQNITDLIPNPDSLVIKMTL
jgi:hypothetical protein